MTIRSVYIVIFVIEWPVITRKEKGMDATVMSRKQHPRNLAFQVGYSAIYVGISKIPQDSCSVLLFCNHFLFFKKTSLHKLVLNGSLIRKIKSTHKNLTWQIKTKACRPDHFGDLQNFSTSSFMRSTTKVGVGALYSFLTISLTWKTSKGSHY